MKTTHVRLKKTLTLAAAGKMALATGSASAALGKTDDVPTDENQLPPVSMDQIGFPLDMITPPMSGFDETQSDATFGKAGGSGDFTGSDSGFIWAGELGAPPASSDSGGKDSGDTSNQQQQPTVQARIDFIVNGIRNDIPMQVYLAYATAAGRSDQWLPSATGQLELEVESMQLIAAVETQPQPPLAEFPATPLGHVPNFRTRSVTVPLNLSDLSDQSLAGNNVYFQAIAIPIDQNGEFLFDQSQTSEVDHYMIERYVSDTDSGSKNADSSAQQDAGKTGGTDTGTDTGDTGGK